jgi:hypothetical protein
MVRSSLIPGLGPGTAQHALSVQHSDSLEKGIEWLMGVLMKRTVLISHRRSDCAIFVDCWYTMRCHYLYCDRCICRD